MSQNLVCVATRLRQIASEKVPGFGWVYLDGDVAHTIPKAPDAGIEVQRLFLDVGEQAKDSAAKGVVTKIGGRDDATGCFQVKISGKEYVRHGSLYTAWFEARDPRTGVIRRRSRVVTSALTRARIDDAIRDHLPGDVCLSAAVASG